MKIFQHSLLWKAFKPSTTNSNPKWNHTLKPHPKTSYSFYIAFDHRKQAKHLYYHSVPGHNASLCFHGLWILMYNSRFNSFFLKTDAWKIDHCLFADPAFCDASSLRFVCVFMLFSVLTGIDRSEHPPLSPIVLHVGILNCHLFYTLGINIFWNHPFLEPHKKIQTMLKSTQLSGN